MTDLDLALRRRGALVLMQRASVEALLVRMSERPQGGGVFARALGAIGLARLRAEESEDEARDARAVRAPMLPWAEQQEQCEGYTLAGPIAVVDVKGVLTPEGYYDWYEERFVGGYEGIAAAIRKARADPRAKGILLRIDSPGGFVDGCFELCDEIRAGSARNGGKPVWAAARMAYSAAYAIASACDRVVSPPAAGVGSIGVIILHMDMSEALKDFGVKIEAIESGAHKSDGAWFKPLSDDARTDMQSEVDEIAKLFVAAVVAGRGITAEAVRAQEARCYLARHSDETRSGLALRLVDEIAAEAKAAETFTEFLRNPQPAQPAITQTEADMAAKERKAKIAAILAGDEDDEKKTAKLAALMEEQDEEKSEDEEKDESKKSGEEDEDKDAKAEDDEEEEDDKAEGDEDEKEAKGKKGAKSARTDPFAVLDLPEAKGREGLATELARKVGAGKLTVAEAKSMLAKSPKASRLGEAMAGRDKNPGADAPKGGSGKGLAAAVDRLVAGQSGQKKTG
jgi:signal peptide peptidase SppA